MPLDKVIDRVPRRTSDADAADTQPLAAQAQRKQQLDQPPPTARPLRDQIDYVTGVTRGPEQDAAARFYRQVERSDERSGDGAGLSIEVLQETNRLIHTPDTGMKAQVLRGLAYVGRGFRWDKGGEVREGKQYARPEHYSPAEIENLHEAGEQGCAAGQQEQHPLRVHDAERC